MTPFLKNCFVRKYAFAEIGVAVCVLLMSLVIAPYYVHGDQGAYHRAYDAVRGLSIKDGYDSYVFVVTGKEFIHFFIIWLASGWGIEKNLIMAVSNSVLAYFVMRLLGKWRASVFVAVSLVLTNFYMFVMYFAAERLKFGFIFLALSMLYLGQNKSFYASAMLAIVSHTQMLLLYAGIFFTRLAMSASRFFRTFQFSVKNVTIPLLLIGPIVYIFSEYLYVKLGNYNLLSTQFATIDYTRATFFLILSLWYSKNKKETLLLFIPIMVAISIVGEGRVNMMAYFIFLYYGIQYKRGLNIGVLGTAVYFAFKAYIFVVDIIKEGDGFATMVGSVHAFLGVIPV